MAKWSRERQRSGLGGRVKVVSARGHVLRLARECGFDLVGITPATPVEEAPSYANWIHAGMAGEMHYLTDYRADKRSDPKSLLAAARSIICTAKLYNVPQPYSVDFTDGELGWISRYAWGEDYHHVLTKALKKLAELLIDALGAPFEWKVAVDTAPLLERSYARRAGLGWIGKNTCLINEGQGSWFFLGELLTSLDIEPDSPPPDRCGTCTRCIDACPTKAIVPTGAPTGPQWALDSRLCISYFTIEMRGSSPEELRTGFGNHIFGCDICQDVCPWNGSAPVTIDPAFAASNFAPPLEKMALLSEAEFRQIFRDTPVTRAKYAGFLRNVAVAMGNSGLEKFRAPLTKLLVSEDEVVAQNALWALNRLSAPIKASY